MKRSFAATTALFVASSLLAARAASAQPPHAPRCTVSDAPPAIIRAVAPDYPVIAAMQGITGTAVVQVDLASNGDVRMASIRRSSGNEMLDREAVRTAKTIGYSAAVHGCAGVPSSSLIDVQFE